ncbi:HNH endonuclease [Butyribacter intestini]|uniref:HNH endonuclease n=1 Tax=Butyribacter intestini TaxID=1703332 RepID=UPI0024C7EE49|nr:MAG: HNH endonuclease [Lachnospiraceae bacterium]
MINLSIAKDKKIKLAKMIVDKYEEQEVKQNRQKKMISRYIEVDSWCKKYIQIEGRGLSLMEVICADYIKLCKIKEKFEEYKYEWNKLKWDKKITADYFMIDTLYKRNFPRKEFFSELNVNVCPYCNRNFINSYQNVSTYQLDHFFPKSEYPLLAVSFENLIPVCAACNYHKREQMINYSLYDKRYKIDSLLKFSYVIKDTNYLLDKSGISISIQAKDSGIQKNIDVFELEKLYQIHTDVVQECIKKGMMYSEEYINGLVKTYSNIFESKEEIYQLVFGNYFKGENYCDRPLAKMTKDIVKELFEVIYAEDIDKIFTE